MVAILEWVSFLGLTAIVAWFGLGVITSIRATPYPRGSRRINLANAVLVFVWFGFLILFLLMPEINKLHLLWLFPAVFTVHQLCFFLILKSSDKATCPAICESFALEMERAIKNTEDIESAVKTSMVNVILKYNPSASEEILGRIRNLNMDAAYAGSSAERQVSLFYVLFNLNLILYDLEYGTVRSKMQQDVLNL